MEELYTMEGASSCVEHKEFQDPYGGCSECYSEDTYEKEDIGAIQSELAKEAIKKIRSEAPWILSED